MVNGQPTMLSVRSVRMDMNGGLAATTSVIVLVIKQRRAQTVLQILCSVVQAIHVMMDFVAVSGVTVDQVRHTVMSVAKVTARVYLSKIVVLIALKGREEKNEIKKIK